MRCKEGGHIGRLLVAEFTDNDRAAFDEIMEVLRKYPDFQKYEVRQEPALLLSGLEIYPDQRKIYRDLIAMGVFLVEH